MATADQVVAYLGKPEHRDFPPTAREIADDLRVNPSTVATALRLLQHLGTVKPRGVGVDGGRTWALTDKGA